MGLNYSTVFTQDATPTPLRVGDEWITSSGAFYKCVQVSPAIWANVVPTSRSAVVPYIDAVTETVTRAQFTDGGATVGTYTLARVIPAGALLLPMKMLVPLGFTGDTSATITIGDGSDVDRYMTGTPSVFTTATTGVDVGIVSGLKQIVTANSPVLTVTSAADFTNVTAGSVTVFIPYIVTV